MASDYRSDGREVGSLFRMSAADKARLKAEAEAEGLTLQQLFELRMLGAAKPRRRDGPLPRRRVNQQELPIAG